MAVSNALHDSEDPATPLLRSVLTPAGGLRWRPPLKGISIGLTGFLIVGLAIALFSASRPANDAGSGGYVMKQGNVTCLASRSPRLQVPASRGVAEGVSDKSNYRLFKLRHDASPFPWTNNMLSWQRTGFHFQPERNWMNDPNGPMFYKDWYHFFYQYNPNGAVWGDIVWGHSVSRDLISWEHLPLAMVADQWYDQNGVWSGSATVLPDGQVIMLYTGSSNESVQVQNLAYPKNLSDPLLIEWEKYPGNPILSPPPGIDKLDFRDPTTAWYTSQGRWRITVGSKVNKTGISFVYETDDFKTYKLLPGILHAVPGTGMWECVDLFPISLNSENGLDTSVNGDGVKHVLKASLDDDRHDYYAIGTFNERTNSWIPEDPKIDVGIGIRYDYGIFYASKSFFDQKKGRRILWGWIGELDSETADVMKGWASVQGIPRTLVYDQKTKKNLLQWPIEEVESLRMNSKEFHNVVVRPGSIVPLDVGSAAQVDIIAEFELDKVALAAMPGSDEEFSCTANGQASNRGALGPFGVLVLADHTLSEQTPVLFYLTKGKDGSVRTSFCTDQSRSSEANDVNKEVYGCYVPVLEEEKFSMRILVDHSIVEGFAQGGRTCITSRVYPTRAMYGDARVFLFNNATDATVTATVKIWQMNSTLMRPYAEQ